MRSRQRKTCDVCLVPPLYTVAGQEDSGSSTAPESVPLSIISNTASLVLRVSFRVSHFYSVCERSVLTGAGNRYNADCS